MKKTNFIMITLTTFLITTLFYIIPVFASTPKLDKTAVNLHIEQGYKLKIKGLNKNLTAKWSVKNTKIASISASGMVKGLAEGKTTGYVKIYNKNKLKYTLKAKISVDNKGYATNQNAFSRLLKNAKVSDIIVNGNATLSVIKGSFGKNIEFGGKKLSLTIKAGSSLNSITLSNTQNAKIKVSGQLSYLYTKNDNSKINLSLAGKNAIVNSIHLDKPTTLDFKSDGNKAHCDIFVLAKSDIKISGKKDQADKIIIDANAEETSIIADSKIELFTDARTVLVVNESAKDSKITTLNYKTPITITNNTDTEIIVTTPSVEKKVEPNSTHTVSGKN